MSTDEVRTIKVFGGWEFLEGMINAYPKANYIRYIAFSNEEKLIIERYYFSKKNTPEFYNKDVDIRLYKDDDDMIFDRCAGNLPFGSHKKGDKNLYIKLLRKVVPSARKSRIVHPKTFVIAPTMKDNDIDIKEHIIDEEDISGTNFDADFSNDLGIFSYDNSVTSNFYKKLFFKNYKDPVLAELIYNEFENMPKMKDNLIQFNDSFKADKSKYYLGFRKLLGHTDLKTGVRRWDFWVFDSIPYETKKGVIRDYWVCGLEFSSKKDFESYSNYLNSDIALFSLYMYKKNRNLGIGSVPNVPYKIDLNILSEKIGSISKYSKEDVINYITEEMKPYGLKAKPKKEK